MAHCEPPVSIHERLYAVLKELIDSNQVRAGQRLTESQVVDTYSVGRTPARLALKQLFHEGLINKDESRGYVVSGRAQKSDRGTPASLQPLEIDQVNKWEYVLAEIETDLYTRIIFQPVRMTEVKVAEYFGVSRTIARDVLARLHSRGLLSKGSAGQWVADQITPERGLHLYQLRSLLEPAALLDAFVHAPSSLLSNMRKSLLKAKKNVDTLDGRSVEALEKDLHVIYLGYCKNPLLLAVLEQAQLVLVINKHIQDIHNSASTNELSIMVDQHLSIVELLIDNEPEKAAACLRLHLEKALSIWFDRYQLMSRDVPQSIPSYMTSIID